MDGIGAVLVGEITAAGQIDGRDGRFIWSRGTDEGCELEG
jgi:hypothetical protein